MRPSILSLLLIATFGPASAADPAWQREASGTVVELRGLSVVSPTVAWASGAKGTVLRTIDGNSWQTLSVPDAAGLDFRDIHAVDANIALAMSAGPGAASRVYRTADGGASWQLLTTNASPEGFWDALAFWDARNGILFGDPVKGQFQVLLTSDGGASWQQVDPTPGLAALADEGAFAASGSCLTVAGSHDAWIVSGGAATARALHSSDRGRSWRPATLPIPAGAPTKGAFSVGFANPREGVAVGGDYKQAQPDTVNGARSDDGGASWTPVAVLPAGFMSVVVPVPGAPSTFVAAGLAGSGLSTDGGLRWTELDRTPVNTVGFATPATGWAVGPKGLLMKYVGPSLAGVRTAQTIK